MSSTSGLVLRAMTTEDIAGGLRLCRTSGWNQLEEDWRLFTDSPGSGGLLIERAGNVLGTAAYIRYDALAWIAMMLVDPAERGAGLGARLLAEALAALADAPCVGLDATPAGEPLYRRFGFTGDYSLVRAKATIDSARFADPVGPARRMLHSDLAAVCRWDREVFGADRGGVLAALFERAPECAWMANDAAGVKGYTFGRPGHRYHQLGPVVAADAATARDLVTRCLSPLGGRVFAIDVPLLDGEWLDFLKSAGFVEERPFLRMFLRGHVHPGIPARQYAICGPEFA
ncbi:MAG: GNAT family N-acetyltransferase [Candidatus Solibacter sp.]|nr:GNAT family N-acetyltransferase [Candidatus Solibacter sp.]